MPLTVGAYLSFWLRYAHFSLIFRPIFIFMAFPVVIFKHFFSQNFYTHDLKTSIILYSIRLRRVVKFFDWVQSLQTQAYKDNFHGKLIKLENGFSQIFYLQCHSKNQYKSSAWMLVRCGSAKMKNVRNDVWCMYVCMYVCMMYECVT